MAFKREADSHEWLSLLKKRRIAELIAEDIPEDEAVLMKNGRFCCTVCPHRPIFDTPQMLAHHRTGRKHAEAQNRHLDKKLEIDQLVQKRRHDKYLQGNKVSSSNATTSRASDGQHPLLTTQRYEPTVKKSRKVKPGQRKPIVDLETVLDGAQTISEFQRQKSESKSEDVIVKPYRSKHAITVSRKSSVNMQGTKQYSGNQSDNRLFESDFKQDCESTSQSSSSDKSVVYVHPQNTKKSKLPKTCTKLPSVTDSQRRKTAELYLQARESGWKRALDGTWTRDEDVEFDSDEEAPDIP